MHDDASHNILGLTRTFSDLSGIPSSVGNARESGLTTSKFFVTSRPGTFKQVRNAFELALIHIKIQSKF